MNFRLHALLASLLLIVSASSRAQTTGTTATANINNGPVVVYRLDFSSSGSSINFRPYTGGYFIADLTTTSGTGSLILTQVVGGTRKYYTTNDYGSVFYARKGSETKAVMIGNTFSLAGKTSGTGTNLTTSGSVTSAIILYAIGDAKDAEDYSVRNLEGKLRIASKLIGHAIFCDSQEDLPFAFAPGENVGTAGALTLTMDLDEGQTNYSKERNAGRTDMLTKLQTELKSQSYTDGNAATTGTGTTATTGTTGR